MQYYKADAFCKIVPCQEVLFGPLLVSFSSSNRVQSPVISYWRITIILGFVLNKRIQKLYPKVAVPICLDN
jgi:hypothetical protein